MRTQNMVIGVLVVLLILTGREIIRLEKSQNKNATSVVKQFEELRNSNSLNTQTENKQEAYKKLLQDREQEAERIRLQLSATTTK